MDVKRCFRLIRRIKKNKVVKITSRIKANLVQLNQEKSVNLTLVLKVIKRKKVKSWKGIFPLP